MNNFIPLDQFKPTERQRVIVTVHAYWVVDGKIHEDYGVETHLTYFTSDPQMTEHGKFIDGFAFNDDDLPGNHWKIKYWAPLPLIPADA